MDYSHLENQYAGMSDEQFAALKPTDLTPDARARYDRELQRRSSAEWLTSNALREERDREQRRSAVFGDNARFSDFVERANTDNKGFANFWLVIGLAGFGPLVLLHYFLALRQGPLAAIHAGLFVVAAVGSVGSVVTQQPLFSWLLPAWYIAGWVHVNSVFNAYRKCAAERLAELAELGDRTFDRYAEEAILHTYLHQDKEAGASFQRALDAGSGSPLLAFLAGAHLERLREHQLAADFLKRAVAGAPTPAARVAAEKLLRKVARKAGV